MAIWVVSLPQNRNTTQRTPLSHGLPVLRGPAPPTSSMTLSPHLYSPARVACCLFLHMPSFLLLQGLHPCCSLHLEHSSPRRDSWFILESPSVISLLSPYEVIIFFLSTRVESLSVLLTVPPRTVTNTCSNLIFAEEMKHKTSKY